jgi:hypothetical protein
MQLINQLIIWKSKIVKCFGIIFSNDRKSAIITELINRYRKNPGHANDKEIRHSRAARNDDLTRNCFLFTCLRFLRNGRTEKLVYGSSISGFDVFGPPDDAASWVEVR